jgi:hypothetical protein
MDATPSAILSWGSALLHGLSRKSPPRISRYRGTSPGVSVPVSAAGRRESTSAPVARLGAPVLPGCVPAGPTPPTTVPLTGFLDLSATSSSLHRPAIFRRVALWGSPFRGLILPRSPGDSSPPDYPHDVSPAGRAPPILGRGIRRRDGRRLGCSGRLLDRLQGFPPRVSRSASPLHFHDAKTDLPLLGFHLLMVCTPVTGGGSRPSTVELHEQEAVACPLPAALHGLPNHPSRSSLTRGPSHHEVLRLRPAPPFGV